MVDRQLRDARLRAGMTQAQLAEAVCATRDAVSRWETGKPMPPECRAMAAKALNAPELILDELQVVFEGGILEAIGWCQEEMPEALRALEQMAAKVRRGQSVRGLDKQAVWDVRTALAALIVALSREGVDVFDGYERHVEHLQQRGYIKKGRGRHAA